MIEKKPLDDSNFGLFANKKYQIGDMILTEAMWYADLTEDWITLSVDEIQSLDHKKREAFLTYSFDVAFGQTKGTFSTMALMNPANFINHSCDPNTEFDGHDNILARKEIQENEQLTIDYATFTVNFDQTFVCGCGSSYCRKQIKKDDWKGISKPGGYNLAKFIRITLNHPSHS